MLMSMTSSQLSEWFAYDQLDPVGEFRGDVRNAQFMSLIVNLFKARFGKKNAKTAKPIDFMPDWGREDKQQKSYQSVDEMKEQIKSIASKFGAGKKKDKNHKRPHELKMEQEQKKKDKGGKQ